MRKKNALNIYLFIFFADITTSGKQITFLSVACTRIHIIKLAFLDLLNFDFIGAVINNNM